MKTSLAASLLCVLGLAGCGNFSSVHRTLDTTQGQGVLIDIKQRAILASTMPVLNATGTQSHPVVCAEPSPDALSAYAFDLAAQGSFPGGKALGGSFGSAESAAYVGLRTQSIQLLRDQFFRACEAYMNRAISAAEYNLLIRRYQKQTAALLAIEQLTGAMSASAAIVSAAGSAKGSTSAFLQSVYGENKNTIAALEKEKATPELEDEKKKAVQAEIDRLKKQNDEILQSLKGAEPEKVAATASGETSEAKPAGTQPGVSSVASVVQHIVDNVTLTDDFLQLCIVNFAGPQEAAHAAAAQPAGANADPRNMREACMRRMGIANERLQLQNTVAKNYLDNIIADKKLTPAQKREELDKITGIGSPEPSVVARTLDVSTTDMKALQLILSNQQKALMDLSDKVDETLCDPKKDAKCKTRK
ncbi:hypothetical protein [Massilia sp. SYSU DXS3249]